MVPCVGIFDSGIGGLSIAAAIREALPQERLCYFGDNAHVPYGERTAAGIITLSRHITRALAERGCRSVVIACNTASSAALEVLRQEFPEIPFVGMEPAVKPAAESTRSGVVGVLATQATVNGKGLADIVERFAKGVEVIQQACPGLAKRIDNGDTDSVETEVLLRNWIEPMMERGIDALVLGCTHYPLAKPLIERIVGPDVRVIEPSAAIARRLGQLIVQYGIRAPEDSEGSLTCWTSGDPERYEAPLKRLGLQHVRVKQGHWQADGTLVLP